jgi:hypothetical protein
VHKPLVPIGIIVLYAAIGVAGHTVAKEYLESAAVENTARATVPSTAYFVCILLSSEMVSARESRRRSLPTGSIKV